MTEVAPVVCFPRPIIVYHKGCSDGVVSAYIAKKALGEVMLWPGIFNDNIDKLLEKSVNTVVYFVDFSYPEKDMLRILDVCSSMVFIDHHKTAEFMTHITNPKLTVVFDTKLAGCQLTWDYFTNGLARHWIVNYVGDRDLFKFELPDSKEVNEGIFASGALWNPDKCSELFDTLEYFKCLEVGKEELKFKNKLYERTKRMAELRYIITTEKDVEKTRKVWILNADHGLVSEVGHMLSADERGEFALVWRYSPDDKKYWVSCRAKDGFNALGIQIKGCSQPLKGHPQACGTESFDLNWIGERVPSEEFNH